MLPVDLKPLSEILPHVPGNPTYDTLYRWAVSGVRGVRLDHQRIGGRIYSSLEAVQHFLDQLNPDPRLPPLIEADTAAAQRFQFEQARGLQPVDAPIRKTVEAL